MQFFLNPFCDWCLLSPVVKSCCQTHFFLPEIENLTDQLPKLSSCLYTINAIVYAGRCSSVPFVSATNNTYCMIHHCWCIFLIFNKIEIEDKGQNKTKKAFILK